jgi:hypothetical protein
VEVQLLPVTVTLIEVLALRLPEVPETLIVAVPALTPEMVIVSPLTEAVATEVLELDAVRVALDAPVTEIASIMLEPTATETEEEVGVSVRLPPLVGALMVKAWVLLQPAGLVYVAV